MLAMIFPNLLHSRTNVKYRAVVRTWGSAPRAPKIRLPFRYVVDYIMFFGTYYESEVDGIVS